MQRSSMAIFMELTSDWGGSDIVKPKMDAQTTARILEMRRSGVSPVIIERKTGVKKHEIVRMLNEHGLGYKKPQPFEFSERKDVRIRRLQRDVVSSPGNTNWEQQMSGNSRLEPIDISRVRALMAHRKDPVRAPATCQWPFGDPRSESFGFCGCKAEPGRPYCEEHLARSTRQAD